MEEDREAALAQLNKAVLELSIVELPPQTDILYQIWYVNMVLQQSFPRNTLT